MKQCNSCLQNKLFLEFGFTSKNKVKHKTICKTCETEKSKTWRQSNKQKVIKNSKKYYNNHKDKIAERNKKKYLESNGRNASWKKGLANKFNIGVDEYNRLLAEQSSKCKICNTHEDVLQRRLAVDHDHDTGQIRGLLCDKCNMAIGLFNDSTILLTAALRYLEGR